MDVLRGRFPFRRRSHTQSPSKSPRLTLKHKVNEYNDANITVDSSQRSKVVVERLWVSAHVCVILDDRRPNHQSIYRVCGIPPYRDHTTLPKTLRTEPLRYDRGKDRTSLGNALRAHNAGWLHFLRENIPHRAGYLNQVKYSGASRARDRVNIWFTRRIRTRGQGRIWRESRRCRASAISLRKLSRSIMRATTIGKLGLCAGRGSQHTHSDGKKGRARREQTRNNKANSSKHEHRHQQRQD